MKKLNFLLPVIFVSLLSFVSADADYGCGFVGGMMGSYGSSWMFFGWIFWVLIFVALILGIIWLIKQIQKPNRR